MKITALPQKIYRNVNRAREVVAVLVKFGLADWIARLDLEFAKDILRSGGGEALARHSQETRIRLAATELGPTFVKLGQILSTRPDLVGTKLAAELEQLQSHTPSDSPEEIRNTLEQELGQPVEEVFAEFTWEPLASASIGQVHTARLKSGESVVVKVRHARIEDTIRRDMDILVGLSQLAELYPDFKNYRPHDSAVEFQRVILRELDFGQEERNIQQFAAMFAGDERIHIPKTYPELSTSKVLTMEHLRGIPISDTEALRKAGADLPDVAKRGAELYLDMIFRHGCYHADPHPGNILIQERDVIGLIDFGMVGRLDERLREDIEEMLVAIGSRDATHLASVIMRVGSTPPGLDQGALSVDVHEFVQHYTHQSLDQLDLTGALTELMELIRRYGIVLPARVGMLIKVLIMLEGTSRLLNPRFCLVDILQPYHRRLFLHRISPLRQLKKLRRLYGELEYLAEVLPRYLLEILQQVRAGKFDVHLDHRGLEPSVNRLVLGMLASSLFVGSCLLMSRNVPPVIDWPPYFPVISVPGTLGCLLSLALGLRLLWAIRKSGHLDRR